MKAPELIALGKLAETAAREAGRILREDKQQLRQVTFSDQRDVKLAADAAAETLIRQRLAAGSALPVYGEELGGDSGLIDRGELVWVVDPLDGTFNYLRGNPLCAVSIGLMRGEEPLLGVIYDFNQDRLYKGSVAEAFTTNGSTNPIQWAESLSGACLCTGFPVGMSRDADSMARFVALLAPYKKVRMVGTAALALAMVANGQVDAYYETNIRLWDVAAGLALVKAAGGALKITRGNPALPLAYDIWAAGKAEFIR